jgi:hypothetical protein
LFSQQAFSLHPCFIWVPSVAAACFFVSFVCFVVNFYLIRWIRVIRGLSFWLRLYRAMSSAQSAAIPFLIRKIRGYLRGLGPNQPATITSFRSANTI